jgi:hypothetical protein
MSEPTDENELLADVLAESSPAEFREAALSETLRHVRRRRHFRQGCRLAAVIGLLGVAALLAGRHWGRSPLPAEPVAGVTAPPPAYTLVRTQPLRAVYVVTTQQFSPVAEITTSKGGYRMIDDHQLLDLAAGEPAILVRTGPHSEELVFAARQDGKGVPAD